MTEFQSDPVVKKCVILQDKLNALLSNLKNETSGLSEKETQQPVVRDGGNGRGFVEREAVMARANSLKKALRGVIDVTEKGDYAHSFTFPLPPLGGMHLLNGLVFDNR